MGTCHFCLTSNDGKSDEAAEQEYLNSIKPEPQPKEIASQSKTISDTDGEGEAEGIQNDDFPSISMNPKTMELLAQSMNDIGLTPMEYGLATDIQYIDYNPQPQLSITSSVSNESLPMTDKAENFELHEIEKNVTSERVKKLTEIFDADELQQMMSKEYSPEPYTDIEDEEESSMSENEKLEIQQRKSQKNPNKEITSEATYLYRENTERNWNTQQIDVLANDMGKQLLTLTKQHSASVNKKNKQYNIVVGDVSDVNVSDINVSENDMDEDDIDDLSDSHLFRNKSSHKWNVQEMNCTKAEMQKELKSLMLFHQKVST